MPNAINNFFSTSQFMNLSVKLDNYHNMQKIKLIAAAEIHHRNHVILNYESYKN